MKKSKFTEQQIAFEKAGQSWRGVPEDGHLRIDVLCCKQLYGGLMPSEVRSCVSSRRERADAQSCRRSDPG